MALESPIQIDLSQKNSWDQIDDSMLSDQEKKLLAEQFAKESESIIYLTRQEIQDFKNILSSEIPEIVTSELQDFVTEQKEEGLSSSDIVGEANEHAEILDIIDEYSKDVLFWEDGGVFSNLSIDPIAQDTMAVSLSMSILEQLANSEDIDIEEVKKSLESKNLSAFSSIVDKLEFIKTLSQDTQIVWPGKLVPRLQISDFWRKNSIFMNPNEWKLFFDNIFSAKLENTWIEAYLEDANQEEDIPKVDLSALGVEMNENINKFIERFTPKSPEDAQDFADALSWITPPIPEQTNSSTSPEKGSFFDKILKLIEKFFSGIIKFWEDIAWKRNNENNVQTPSENTGANPEEVAPQTAQKIREFFTQHANDGIFVGMNKESIVSLFPKSGELSETAQKIMQKLESLPGDESLEEKMQHIFIDEVQKVDGDSSQGSVARMTRFLSDMSDITDTNISLTRSDGTLNEASLLTAINAYSSYRKRNQEWKNLPENADKNRNMTFVEYFTENQENNDK